MARHKHLRASRGGVTTTSVALVKAMREELGRGKPDIIGVNSDWFNVTLTAAANEPALRRKIVMRLEVMWREAEHAIKPTS